MGMNIHLSFGIMLLGNSNFHILLKDSKDKFALIIKINLKNLNELHFIIVPQLNRIDSNFDLPDHLVLILFINAHGLRHYFIRTSIRFEQKIESVNIFMSSRYNLGQFDMICRHFTHLIYFNLY